MINNLLKSCKEFKQEAIEILGTEQSVFVPLEYHGIFDIAILTATIDEFEAVKSIIEKIKKVSFAENDASIYFSGELRSKNKVFKIILPYPYDMGIEASSSLTTKVISSFRPKYIFMVGVCAGNKNVTKIGDIIVAERSLNYNKVVLIERKSEEQDKKFMHHVSSINRYLKMNLELFSRSEAIEQIKTSYGNHEKHYEKLTCHVGLLVTGSSLMRSDKIIAEINQTYPGIKGLDMETYGVYYASTQVFKDYAPNFVSIKSVSDYGDTKKHPLSATERKKYALHTSSQTLKKFITENLE